jgi:competence protein ComEC
MNDSISNTNQAIVYLASFIAGVSLGVSTGNFYINFLFIITLFIASVLNNLLYKKLLIMGVIFFIVGFNYSILRTPQLAIDDISFRAPLNNAVITGRVETEPRLKANDKLELIFKVDSIILEDKKKPVSGKVRVLIIDKNQDFNVIATGYKLKLMGKLYLPRSATNPYEFDYKNYLLNKGISTNMLVMWDGYQLLSPPDSLLAKFMYNVNLLKNHIKYAHEKALPDKEAQLLGGIVLGERAIPMDNDMKQTFINSGLIHILAASGINVALLALAWIFITSRLGLPHTFQITGGMIIVIFYSLLTGLPPSVLRASIMLELVLLGKLIDREANMIAIILFAGSLLLFYNPYMINDIGFQLSFVTTFGLILSVPVFQKYITTIPEALAMLVLIPFIAQMWALPVLLYHFNNLATYSVFANVMAMPLVALITYGGFLSSLLSMIPLVGIDLVSFIDSILEPVLSLLIHIAAYFSGLPSSLEHFSIDSIIGVMFYYAVTGVILYLMFKKASSGKYIVSAASIILFLMIVNFIKPFDNTLKITFFDVGQGDSILIRTPEDNYLLIDGGRRFGDDYNSAEWVLNPYLYSQKVKKIDAIFLTHPQNDHIGGIPEILDSFHVDYYVDSGLYSYNKAYNEILKRVYSKNIAYLLARKGDTLYYSDDLQLKVLHPTENLSYISDINDYSLVIRLDYKNFSALFTGDTEADIVDKLPEKELDVDLLKVGHHGSRNSVNEKLLEATSPEIAVLTTGKSKYHPHKSTIELLNRYRIKTLKTHSDGAIEVRTDGITIQNSTFANKIK